MPSTKKPRPPALHTACMTDESTDLGSTRVKKSSSRRSTPSTPSSASIFITTNPVLLTNGGGTAEVSAEERRAIRAQAARSSAAARTATLAKKRAEKRRQEGKDKTPPGPLTPITPGVEAGAKTHAESQQDAGQKLDPQLVIDAQGRQQSRSSRRLLLDSNTDLVITPNARTLLSAATCDPFDTLPNANWHNTGITIRRDSTTDLVDHCECSVRSWGPSFVADVGRPHPLRACAHWYDRDAWTRSHTIAALAFRNEQRPTVRDGTVGRWHSPIPGRRKRT